MYATALSATAGSIGLDRVRFSMTSGSSGLTAWKPSMNFRSFSSRRASLETMISSGHGATAVTMRFPTFTLRTIARVRQSGGRMAVFSSTPSIKNPCVSWN
jgi:hypothetical protein